MDKPLCIEYDYDVGNKFIYGLFSDIHKDSEDCDTKQFEKDMEKVINNNGRLFFNGDFFNFIMPKDFKRYSQGSDPFKGSNHINQIVMDGFETLRPYADYIDMIGSGNHETSVQKFHDFDPIQSLVWELNKERNKKLQPIKHGGYSGYIVLKFKYKNGQQRQKYTIGYHHGRGGACPVTKGITEFNRYLSSHDGVDLVWFGHKHTSLHLQEIKEFVDNGDNIKRFKIDCVFTPGYKIGPTQEEESFNEKGYKLSWEEENFLARNPIGFKMLELTLAKETLDVSISS